MTAEPHADGVDLILSPGPVDDAAEYEACLSNAHSLVEMLHTKLPTYPWRCEVRHGDESVARARYDLAEHDVPLDDVEQD